MEGLDNGWCTDEASGSTDSRQGNDALHQRLHRQEAELVRLVRSGQLKDRQINELREVLAHLATAHYAVEVRMQRELDALRMAMSAAECEVPHSAGPNPGFPSGVTVQLPYVTSALIVLFDAMRVFWAGCERERPPKSSSVARAIDERLGLSAQANGEASRSAQAYASAIRPDWAKETDKRHRVRRARKP